MPGKGIKQKRKMKDMRTAQATTRTWKKSEFLFFYHLMCQLLTNNNDDVVDDGDVAICIFYSAPLVCVPIFDDDDMRL